MSKKVSPKTPAMLGFTFPPEWYPHEGTWLSWPKPDGISFPGTYHKVIDVFINIISKISEFESVHINVSNFNYEYIVKKELKSRNATLRRIFFHHINSNECWCRDHGPAFVIRKAKNKKIEGAIVNWCFNAWGNKYPEYHHDNDVPLQVAKQLGLNIFNPGIVMEGGAVEFNGLGTVLTTKPCLLNINRNPGLSKAKVEQYLKDYYGQKHVLWLGQGIAGDDTDSHIDGLARFINHTTLVVAIEEDLRDENYHVLQENLNQAKKLRDQDGNPFNIITLPMPGVIKHEGHRLPATYLNFYFVNGALLVPTYRNKKNDKLALKALQTQLPKHKVIGIDCTELIWGLGAIHCLTQQQPRFHL
jgi:agmatine deiminase